MKILLLSCLSIFGTIAAQAQKSTILKTNISSLYSLQLERFTTKSQSISIYSKYIKTDYRNREIIRGAIEYRFYHNEFTVDKSGLGYIGAYTAFQYRKTYGPSDLFNPNYELKRKGNEAYIGIVAGIQWEFDSRMILDLFCGAGLLCYRQGYVSDAKSLFNPPFEIRTGLCIGFDFSPSY
jgi:hypothetical protein